VVFREPAKEFDALAAVWEMAFRTERVLPRVVAPEMDAVPPTSKVVSVLVPALMPRSEAAEVSSKPPEREALEPVKLPVTARAPESVILEAVSPPEVMDLVMLREPAKEFDPVPVPRNLPAEEISPVA